ncbi:MAG: Rv1355c family protein [Brevibacillus sp.]|nr:Rv1355c family protein [Brevibacillus sp.]
MMREIAGNEECWQPLVLDLSKEEDRIRLSSLKSSGLVWQTHDQIEAMLRDLIKTRTPGQVLTEAELAERIDKLLDKAKRDEYGKWIYYPWSGRLVHLLDEQEFQELRLNRNRYKLTAEEQAACFRLTIGIVGLSVGNAVALTLAMEGGFGHVKLADFDTLDLSNMNRLRAGVHEIGLPKTVLAARQIYEINPYARITLFSDGVTADNLDRFLLGEQPVDILVDECDSIDMKFSLRERARTLGIPVLMETSDRGMLDVERFDLEPDRPLFHGLCEQRPDPESRVAAVLKLTGIHTISTRAAVSLLEIGQTITTWPQLASDVMLGGAAVAAAVRRIALGRPLASGRRYLDVEEWLTSDAVGTDVPAEVSACGGAAAAAETAAAGGAPPASQPSRTTAVGGTDEISSLIHFVVEQAVRAPSLANSQPWRFHHADKRLWVSRARELAAGPFDLSGHASSLALGAAIENIVIAAAYRHYDVLVQPYPLAGNDQIVAQLTFEPEERPSLRQEERAALFDALTLGAANRGGSIEPGPLTDQEQRQLRQVFLPEGIHLHLLSDDRVIGEIAAIVGEGTRIVLLNEVMDREISAVPRRTPEQAAQFGDGIDIHTLQFPTAQQAALTLLARPDVAAELRQLGLGQAVTKGVGQRVASSAALGLIAVESEDKEIWLEAGRYMQRLWLAAIKLGLSIQPAGTWMSLMHPSGQPTVPGLSPREASELIGLFDRLKALWKLGHAAHPALLFRIFRGSAPPVKSHRLPVDRVLQYGFPPQWEGRK